MSWKDQRGLKRPLQVSQQHVVRSKGGLQALCGTEVEPALESTTAAPSTVTTASTVSMGSVITSIMGLDERVMDVVIVGRTWACSSWLPVALRIGSWQIVGFVSDDSDLPEELAHVPLAGGGRRCKSSAGATRPWCYWTKAHPFGLYLPRKDLPWLWPRCHLPVDSLRHWRQHSRTSGHWVYGGVSTWVATVHLYWLKGWRGSPTILAEGAWPPSGAPLRPPLAFCAGSRSDGKAMSGRSFSTSGSPWSRCVYAAFEARIACLGRWFVPHGTC